MISMLITAFIIGAIGTVHCLGMCGPLALSLPVVSNNVSARFISALLYNLGRVFTYSVLGAVVGFAGLGFAFFGYQQLLSVILGAGLFVFILVPKTRSDKPKQMLQFFVTVRNWLGVLFQQKNYRSVFFIGVLNGLLPCGLVYIAIAGAVSTASVFKSSLFMAAFGLGTLPLMWGVAFFGCFVNLRARYAIKKLYPYIMAGMAALLIIRGLGLDIPFLSPALFNHDAKGQSIIKCHS